MTHEVRMELKYCECCGGLMLRAKDSGAVYCGGCAPRMAKVAAGTAEERRGRKRIPVLPVAPTVEIEAVAELELPPPRPACGAEVQAENWRQA